MKNLGLDLVKQEKDFKDTDWVFGAASQPCITDTSPSERAFYLPAGELQFGKEDFMDCASRGPLNVLEAKLNYLYLNGKLLSDNRVFLEQYGYVHNGRIELSDRFIAIKSGTTRNGNSLTAPIDAIHRYGCIPKAMLRANGQMTFDEYHAASNITKEMERLADEFKRRFVVNYEIVREEDFQVALDYDFLIVGLYAWTSPVDGVYPRTDAPENHVVCLHIAAYTAFDNYLDTDGDFIKQLAPDYNFYRTGYRLFIPAQNSTEQVKASLRAELNLWQRLLDLLRLLYAR